MTINTLPNPCLNREKNASIACSDSLFCHQGRMGLKGAVALGLHVLHADIGT